MSDHDGKSALVTGGARGIGEATVRALSAVGMNVIVTDVLDDEGAQVADSLGSTVAYEHLDVTDGANWRDVLSRSEGRFGALSVLVTTQAFSSSVVSMCWNRSAFNASSMSIWSDRISACITLHQFCAEPVAE